MIERLVGATGEVEAVAFQRIRRIDYRTVSVLGFEHTLLGIYDERRMYRIVYPDAPETV